MSEWKKLTAEQVAWLDAKDYGHDTWEDWLLFAYINNIGIPSPEWKVWESTDAEKRVFVKIIDREAARAAGFPMGEAERAQDITTKVHTDAEWQRERRAAWVAFASGALSDKDWETFARAAEWADGLLAEFDKRFGGEE